jgi:hypothetical protein
VIVFYHKIYKMAKLILRGDGRKMRDVNGSIYALIESPMAKIMGLEKDDSIVTELYWSEKHQDYYVACYKERRAPMVEDDPSTQSQTSPVEAV